MKAKSILLALALAGTLVAVTAQAAYTSGRSLFPSIDVFTSTFQGKTERVYSNQFWQAVDVSFSVASFTGLQTGWIRNSTGAFFQGKAIMFVQVTNRNGSIIYGQYTSIGANEGPIDESYWLIGALPPQSMRPVSGTASGGNRFWHSIRVPLRNLNGSSINPNLVAWVNTPF